MARRRRRWRRRWSICGWRSCRARQSGDGRRPKHPAGTPYPRAFDLLVQVYEGGTYDALFTIWRADPERGPAYVRDVFERSERPPLCPFGHHVGGDRPL